MPRGQVKDYEMLRRRTYEWIRLNPDSEALHIVDKFIDELEAFTQAQKVKSLG